MKAPRIAGRPALITAAQIAVASRAVRVRLFQLHATLDDGRQASSPQASSIAMRIAVTRNVPLRRVFARLRRTGSTQEGMPGVST